LFKAKWNFGMWKRNMGWKEKFLRERGNN
jgi:hypothetical protein